MEKVHMEKEIYPEGYHALTPILRVESARNALEFYQRAFDAVEDFRREVDGRILLAVIKVGDSRIMLFDEQNEPKKATTGGDPRGNGLMLKLYVARANETFSRALKAGARQDTAVEDQYFGERSGVLTDPFGFSWQIAEFKEEVPHEIIEQRMHKAMGRT